MSAGGRRNALRRSSMTRCIAVLVTALLLAAPAALAQTTEQGSIRGYVKDAQGGVLPGVTIVARSATVGGVYTAVTDAEGFYRLLRLPPAQFSVSAELGGFSKFVREAIQIRAGMTIEIDIVMQVGGVAETVVVKAETPMLEVKTATQALNTSGELQRQLPLAANRNFASFFFLTPGVVSEENGSHFVHGATYDSQVLQVDGADLTSNLQAVTWYVQFSTEAIEDVQVKTAGMDASAPLTQGAVINIATRSGGNEFHGATGALFKAKAWMANNEPGGTVPRVRLFQPDSSLGGPILKDRAWFFGSHRYTGQRSTASGTADDLAMLAALVPNWKLQDATAGGNNYFVTATGQLSTRQTCSTSTTRTPPAGRAAATRLRSSRASKVVPRTAVGCPPSGRPR
jgi:hypothetical protein